MNQFDDIIREMKRLGDDHPFPPDFTQRTLEKMAAIRPFGVPVTPLPAPKPLWRTWWVPAAAAAMMLLAVGIWAVPRLFPRQGVTETVLNPNPAPESPSAAPSDPRETPSLAPAPASQQATVQAPTAPWFFRPTGKESRDEMAQLAADFDATDWTQVRFPHCLNPIQPQHDSYAWYVCRVTVPEWAKGRGLLLDLGTIDDVDVTYMNGAVVGKTGTFDDKVSSGWNQDRLYSIPSDAVKHGQTNVVAVKVKNFAGLGGMLGQPYVGVPLQSTPEGLFLAEDGDPAKYAALDVSEARWDMFILPALGWPKEAQQKGHSGWYRYRFDLPPELMGRDLLVDLGRVYDVGACYLNGKLVGQMGRFAPQSFPQTAGRFRVVLPRGQTKGEGNVLAVRVNGTSGFGGLLGTPTLALEDQDLLRNATSAAQVLDVDAKGLSDDENSLARRLDLCEYLIHSGQESTVADFCERVQKGSASAETVQRARCLRIYALWLSGKGEDAWKEFLALDSLKPIPYSTAAAMAEYCRAGNAPADGVLYVGKDTVTKGDWDMRYGLQETVLCAMTAPFDVVHGIGPGLKFKLTTGTANEVPRAWLGAPETTDQRALFWPSAGKRRYASWDDRGEARPFDENGPDLIMNVSVPQGPHLLSFYLVDWDWFNGAHPRVQSLLLLDAAKKPLTVVSTGRFGAGQYERFLVEGPKDMTVRFGKHRSPCVVVSGVFLDKVLPLQPPPVALKGRSESTVRLQVQYDGLAKASRESLLATVRGDDLTSFEKAVSGLAKQGRESHLLWYLAECRRLRGDFIGAQQALNRYLAILADEAPRDRQSDTLSAVARSLERLRYRPEAIMAAVSAAAAAKEGSEVAVFESMLKRSQLESLRRLSPRWLAAYPIPRTDPEKVPFGGMPQ